MRRPLQSLNLNRVDITPVVVLYKDGSHTLIPKVAHVVRRTFNRVNVCACTSHMTLGINARVPQHGITNFGYKTGPISESSMGISKIKNEINQMI
ncbi:hypothetical protein BpHYR1_049493 [Brachionus plicatilis]|uniref:Uncharacterized protein n=1 Tax=Brachionus plicatilis TaxID=10195 RepID=A0A3M7S877_BRAPC|nr:hypothetical protein BpHYR1_049493 [Brachionus plicatilis]